MSEIELSQNAQIQDLVPGVVNVKSDTYNCGPRVRVTFANGYGASVVCNFMSYGHESGLWELGVLGTDGGLTYETSVTDDVIGWLTPEDVLEKLCEISALAPGLSGPQGKEIEE